MADRLRPHLVCYDIREDRRLRRIHRTLKSWGLPIQYSVFQCWLTHRQRGQLTEILRRAIDTRVDDLRIYSLVPGTVIYYQGPAPLPPGLIVDGLVMLPMFPDESAEPVRQIADVL